MRYGSGQRSRWVVLRSASTPILCILLIGVSSCSTVVPEEEVVIAQAAVAAAKEAKADVVSPKNFQKAEDFLRAAMKAKEDHDFGLAKHFALQARHFAEQAEDEAVMAEAQGKSPEVTEPNSEKENSP